MSTEEQPVLYRFMGNIPEGDWTAGSAKTYSSMEATAKLFKVFNNPQPTFDQTDLINSIQKLEFAIVGLSDKINIVIDNLKDSSSAKEEITLRNISVKDAIKEIKVYLKDNTSEVSISELMTSLLIEPSIISEAVDELIKTEDIKEI